MPPAHEQLYLRTLHELVAAGVAFCIIGTYGLRLQCPALAHYPVPDCDLLLPPALSNLNALAGCLLADNWAITLWEKPVQLPLTAAETAGKYYLRARQAGAVLDCAYENDFQTWPDFAKQLHWRQGLPLASATHILFQKAQCNRPSDQKVLQLLAETTIQPTKSG